MKTRGVKENSDQSPALDKMSSNTDKNLLRYNAADFEFCVMLKSTNIQKRHDARFPSVTRRFVPRPSSYSSGHDERLQTERSEGTASSRSPGHGEDNPGREQAKWE